AGCVSFRDHGDEREEHRERRESAPETEAERTVELGCHGGAHRTITIPACANGSVTGRCRTSARRTTHDSVKPVLFTGEAPVRERSFRAGARFYPWARFCPLGRR